MGLFDFNHLETIESDKNELRAKNTSRPQKSFLGKKCSWEIKELVETGKRKIKKAATRQIVTYDYET